MSVIVAQVCVALARRVVLVGLVLVAVVLVACLDLVDPVEDH